MVAVTLIIALEPDVIVGIVQGNAVQPAPLTEVMVRFVGTSVTCTLFASSGPMLDTINV